MATWGALGDSQSDEFRAEQNTGGGTAWTPYTLNWLEQLAQPTELTPFGGAVCNRGLDFGPWGVGRPEPRRSGYAYNCARYNAFMSGVVSAQLPVMHGLVESGTVSHVVIQGTVNELLRATPYPWFQEAYLSPDGGVTGGITGTPLVTFVNQYAGQVSTVVDTLLGAGAEGIVVILPPDYMTYPDVIAQAPDPVGRANVSAFMERIYDAIRDHADSVNASRDVTTVVCVTQHELYPWDTFDGTYCTVAGVQVNVMAPSPNGSPLYRSVDDHTGTLFNALTANAFIGAANQLPGISITPLSDAEILANAGLADPPDPEPDPITGEGAATLPAVVASGAVTSRVTGSGAAALSALQAVGNAAPALTGQGEAALPVLQASGSSTSGLTASGAVGLPAVTAGGAGAAAASGDADTALPALSASGDGAVPVTAQCAATLPAMEASGTSEEVITGSGGATLGAMQAGGSGGVLVQAAGEMSMPALGERGLATAVVSGSGDLSLPVLITTGVATVHIMGGGSVALPALVVSGTTLDPPVDTGNLLAAARRTVSVSAAARSTALRAARRTTTLTAG